MEKRVFRSKIVYWVSIIYFSLITLISFTASFSFFNTSFNLFRFILLISFSIFSLIVCISLFEKAKHTVILINIYTSILIILIIFQLLKNHFEYHIYYNSQVYFLIFLVIFLMSINIFKYNSKKYKEIDEIGKQ